MTDRKPKILVIGASGALGKVVSDVFARRGWGVLRGLRQPDGNPDSVRVDLNERQSVIAAMSQVDLVVNTVPLNFTAEEVALETGGRLLSLAITESAAQLALRNRYLTAPGTVILNAGLAPGITNLVVRDLVSRDEAGRGRLTIAGPLPWRGYRGSGGVRLAHSYFTKSGRHGSFTGRHDTVKIPFPEPVGVVECLGWAERNYGWVERCAASRFIRVYCYVDHAWLNTLIVRLNRAGILWCMPLWPFLLLQRKDAAPTQEHVSIWVSLDVDGVQHSRVIECSGWYLSSANASEVMARKLYSDDRLAGRGCLDSDEVFTLSDIQSDLATVNGLTVRNDITGFKVQPTRPATAHSGGWRTLGPRSEYLKR